MKFINKLITIRQRQAQIELLMRFRSMPDKQLEYCGISPELVSQGINAWPWRQVEADVQTQELKTISTTENPSANESEIQSQVPETKFHRNAA